MRALRFGYNTNGFAHHRLEDALQIIAELGYESVAITLDYHALNPFDIRWVSSRGLWRSVGKQLRELPLNAVIETGARFLLDPRRRHFPTLLTTSTAKRRRRRILLMLACTLGHRLGANVVSFWSGTAPDNIASRTLMNRLVDSCCYVGDMAADLGVRLAFEPEPGMFIDTMAKFEELYDRVRHPALGLTLDIGHLHCQGDTPISNHLRRWKDVLWNVHIEDMKRGVHEHLMFGEGEINFPPILRTLEKIEYAGGVHVELSRHSHDAVETARKALAFLKSQ